MSDNITQKYISVEIQNKYNNSPYRIPLRNKYGIIVEYALVDQDDYEKVSKYKWRLSCDKYTQSNIKNIIYKLHRFIFYGITRNNKIIDHINRDRLDNRKCNLREVTRSQNSQNATRKKRSASQYTGVQKENDGKFRAVCQKKQLGRYDTEIEAAKIYDIYSYQIFGEHALNNRLITYQDAINLLNDNTICKLRDPKFMKDELPENVYYFKEKRAYLAKKLYLKKIYKGLYRKTIVEAYHDIIEINTKIYKVKLMVEIHHYFREITKDDNGIAYLLIRDTRVFVDEDLWHKFSSINWYINVNGYTENAKLGLIHRIVMNAKKDELVDHINNNRNDNRRCNLRIAEYGVNSHNRSKQTGKSSRYIGVSFDKNNKKWSAGISHQNKKYHLGSFENEIDAAEAYNQKAIELYGDYSNLNQL